MKVIGFDSPFKLEEGNQFYEVERDVPTPSDFELLVKVQSISVNPVDTKQRITPVSETPRVLGFDAVGRVEAIGNAVTMFEVGDVVFYSGSPDRDGSNADYQLIDEALVAKAPVTVSAEEAVSLPLTGITASETLFDVFGISTEPSTNRGKSILIINGAGGVGSIATQIAKRYGLTVITTASRDETVQWSKQMGADVVLNHKEDLVQQFKTQQLPAVDYIFCTFNTDMYFDVMLKLIKPRGYIATIVAFEKNQDLNALKDKSVTFTHEFMFTRPLYHTEDKNKQQYYLSEIAKNVDQGIYRPTTTKVLNGLTPENLFEAHQLLENQSMIGKLVINIEE